MQTDGCDSSGFRMFFDRSFYESYNIADLNFVNQFRLKFRCCFII